MTRDALGERMKEFYECIPKTKLMRRTPVAIRIPNFHSCGFDEKEGHIGQVGYGLF